MAASSRGALPRGVPRPPPPLCPQCHVCCPFRYSPGSSSWYSLSDDPRPDKTPGMLAAPGATVRPHAPGALVKDVSAPQYFDGRPLDPSRGNPKLSTRWNRFVAGFGLKARVHPLFSSGTRLTLNPSMEPSSTSKFLSVESNGSRHIGQCRG